MQRKSASVIKKTEGIVSPVMYPYTRAVIESGQGSFLFDVEGNRYIDFTAGIATCAIGHSHPVVVEAINHQAQKILQVCDHVAYYEPYVDYMEDLKDTLPGDLKRGKGIFLDSGAEAVEMALKLARFVTRRPNVLSFLWGFYGRTFGATVANGKAESYGKNLSGVFPGVFQVPYPYCLRCPFGHECTPDGNMPCLNYVNIILESIIDPADVAAILFEPVNGEGGYLVPPSDFMKGLRKTCDRIGAFLIADEAQSGFGRTGKWLASEHFEAVPDILVMAKAIGGGLPLGAIFGKREIMDKCEPSWQGTLLGGNPVSCAAGRATFQVMKNEHVLHNAEETGSFIQQKLKTAAKTLKSVGDVRGKGLMIGVELVQPNHAPANELTSRVVASAVQNGLILTKCAPNVIRISPALNITREQAESGVDILLKILRQ